MSEIDGQAIQALRAASSWLERWGQHVGRCQGDGHCTCGLVAIRHETAVAVAAIDAALTPQT